jgi:hypothetical protein
MAKKNNKAPKEGKSVKVSEKLGDFDIVIDSFGKIQSNYDVDKINEFLNQNVDDKKLKNRNEKEDF